MKKWLCILAVLLVAALAVGLVACDFGGGKTTPTFSITYLVDGRVYETQILDEGAIIRLPSEPKKEGYEFAGWYLDEETTRKFSAGTITTDLTVYAKWNQKVVETHIQVSLTNADGSTYVGQVLASDKKTYDGKGKYTFANGAYYDGEWVQNKMQGNGVYHWTNGNEYEGTFVANKMTGANGILRYADGGLYEGDVVEGIRQGTGTMTYVDRSVYVGEWVADKREGQGTITDAAGGKYEGEWVADIQEGVGTFTYDNGDVLSGTFAGGELQGKGHMECTYWDKDTGDELSTYVGDWLNKQPHGTGTMIYADGSKYEGEWKYNVYSGTGKMTYANGDTFDGDWQNGRIGDTGTYTWADGKSYTGMFMDGEPQGTGTMTYADGNVYTGSWRFGKAHGTGTMTFADGNVYVGEWQNNLQNGTGKLTYADGDSFEGAWVNGEIGASGTYVWKDVRTYTGAFADGAPEGEGTITYAEGATYVGNVTSIGAKVCVESGTGTMTYADGSVYEGSWSGGKYSGSGVMTYENGDSYDGQWSEGVKYGYGVITLKDDEDYVSYAGYWADDKWEGEGELTYVNGNVYSGNFVGGFKKGNGTMTYANNASYTQYAGEWDADKWNGKGTITFLNKDTMSGRFVNNVLKGNGTYTYFETGDVYEGAFVDGVAETTYGTYTWANGNVYYGPIHSGQITTGEGEQGWVFYKDGDGNQTAMYAGTLQNGHLVLGTYAWLVSGDSYIGPFVNDLAHTQGDETGTFRFKVGENAYDEYVGQLAEGKPHGSGKMTYSTGDVYDGSWDKGNRNSGTYTHYTDEDKTKYDRYVGTFTQGAFTGSGTYTYATGDVYEGAVVEGIRQGTGKLTLANRVEFYDGTWQGGAFVSGSVYVNVEGGGHYEGGWANEHENGEGDMYYSNGDTYKGDWVAGKREGEGEFVHYTSETTFVKFEGTWANDFMASGTYTFDNGDTYTGSYTVVKVDGVDKAVEHTAPDQTALYHWAASGDEYTGAFVEGKRTGYGTLNYANGFGNLYEGYFVDGKFETTGDQKSTLTYRTNKVVTGVFVGTFAADHSVSGTMQDKDAEGNVTATYVGDFVDGVRKGEGTYENDSYILYNKNWVDGLANGEGKYTWKNTGSFYEGGFVDNKFEDTDGTKTYKKIVEDNPIVTGIFTGVWDDDAAVSGTMVYYDDKGNITGTYVGGFVGETPKGTGVYTYADQHRVEDGTWDTTFVEGTLTITYYDGNDEIGTFVGGWANGEYSGTGTMTYAEGNASGYKSYTGGFNIATGLPAGKGTMTKTDDSTMTGNWFGTYGFESEAE